MGWRDEVLKEFAPETARLTLVADPDGLLLEEGSFRIRERGYDLILLMMRSLSATPTSQTTGLAGTRANPPSLWWCFTHRRMICRHFPSTSFR